MSIPIGELSKRSGVHIETIRYYERIGLTPEPRRSTGQRRLYGLDDIRRLHFIRRSRELGFSLDEIRNLFRLAEHGGTCGEVRDIALAQATHIREKVADLERMERILLETASQCKGGAAPSCPVVDALFDGDTI